MFLASNLWDHLLYNLTGTFMNPIVSGYMSDSNEEHRFLFGLSNIQISISKKKWSLEYGEIPKKKTILISFFFSYIENLKATQDRVRDRILSSTGYFNFVGVISNSIHSLQKKNKQHILVSIHFFLVLSNVP